MKTDRVWVRNGGCYDVVHDRHEVLTVHRKYNRWLHVWWYGEDVVAVVRMGRLRARQSIDGPAERHPDVALAMTTTRDQHRFAVADVRYRDGAFVCMAGTDMAMALRVEAVHVLTLFDLDYRVLNPPDPDPDVAARQDAMRNAGLRSERDNARRRTEFRERLAEREAARKTASAAAAARRREAREAELIRRRDDAVAAADRQRKAAMAEHQRILDAHADRERQRAALHARRADSKLIMPSVVEVVTGETSMVIADFSGPWRPTEFAKSYGPSWVTVDPGTGGVEIVAPEYRPALPVRFGIVANDPDALVVKLAEVRIMVHGQTMAMARAIEEAERARARQEKLDAFRRETEAANRLAAARGEQDIAPMVVALTEAHREATEG